MTRPCDVTDDANIVEDFHKMDQPIRHVGRSL